MFGWSAGGDKWIIWVFMCRLLIRFKWTVYTERRRTYERKNEDYEINRQQDSLRENTSATPPPLSPKTQLPGLQYSIFLVKLKVKLKNWLDRILSYLKQIFSHRSLPSLAPLFMCTSVAWTRHGIITNCDYPLWFLLCFQFFLLCHLCGWTCFASSFGPLANVTDK